MPSGGRGDAARGDPRRRPGRPDGGPRARERRYERHRRAGGHPDGRWTRAVDRLQRQPHRHRRPPVLLEIGLGDGLVAAPAATKSDPRAMLVRRRLSRIYFDGKFFDYPLKADLDTALKLGLWRCAGFAASYAWAKVFPRRPEASLEDFFINRFGRRLYRQFFRDYTEKVWGTSCDRISAQWGAQRVKSLSIAKALRHAILKPFRRVGSGLGAAEQTSLIERFLYPKYGPGPMWEVTAERLRELGARLELEAKVHRIEHHEGRVRAVLARRPDGREQRFEADAVISSMPVRDLVLGLAPDAPRPRPGRPHACGRSPQGSSTAISSSSGRSTGGSCRTRRAGVRSTWCPTTGSTSRNPGSRSAGCKSSITGARIWSATPIPSGSAWSISAARATSCGKSPTTN